jgi:hypothetical protein
LQFFAIFEENCPIADKFSNQATLVKEGDIVANGKVYTQPIA